MADDDLITDSQHDNEDDTVLEEKYDVNYRCLRCGTIMSSAELGKYENIELKCVCSFKVFLKVRSPIVKSVKAI